MKSFFLLLVLIYFFTPGIKAQDIGTTINAYTSNYPGEQTYLHLDNNLYSAGDTVWFKAYVLANSLPSALSTNLYIDWYDASDKLLLHQVYPIYHATANGQFSIPATYASSTIHLLAYTRWMLNSDSEFLFHREINILPAKSVASAKQKMEEQKIVLQFFPEGGNLIAGVLNKVAFKATDHNGNPVELNAIIKDNRNDSVTKIATTHDGMGFFYFTPKDGVNYVAAFNQSPENISTINLPVVQSSGIAMEIFLDETNRKVVIRKSGNNEINLNHIHVLASIAGTVVYLSNIDLSSGESIESTIPVQGFPSGILTITVLDKDWNPLAERISFIKNQDIVSNIPQLSITKKGLDKKSLNTIALQYGDSLPANLSIAITDGDIPSDSAANIISYLLLSGQLNGSVHNPAYYFTDTGMQTQKELDLVMLTNGWRKYNWHEIVQGLNPIIKYPRDSDYFFLSGDIISNKNKPPDQISLMLKSSESFSAHNFSVNKDDHFEDSSLILYDTTKIAYRMNGNEENFEIKYAQLPKEIFSGYPFSTNAYQLVQKENAAASDVSKFYKNTLAPVTIVHKRFQTKIDSVENLYLSPQFKNVPALKTAYVEDDPVLGSYGNDFRSFILAKLGMDIYNRWVEYYYLKLKYFVDEQPVPQDAAFSTPISEIVLVKYYKYFALAAGAGGRAGVIAIYTKRAFFDSKQKTASSSSSPTIIGYSISKEFYNPEYGTVKDKESIPDTRKTLYWNPQVDLNNNANKNVQVSFYNNDYAKKFRIIMEGIKSDGTPIHIEKVVE